MNTDFLHKITNWIDHNRGQFFGLLIPVTAVLILLAVGCSKTQSLKDPTKKVDRQTFVIEGLAVEQDFKEETIQLQAQLEKHNARIETYNLQKEAGLADLDQQDLRNQQILEITGGALSEYVSGGTVTAGPIILSLLNLAGIGWGLGNKLDNVRKDKIIEQQKTTV